MSADPRRAWGKLSRKPASTIVALTSRARHGLRTAVGASSMRPAPEPALMPRLAKTTTNKRPAAEGGTNG